MGRIADDKKGFDVKVNRREMIKKAIQAGGVAYVAPMVLASATPASAQVSPGPSPQCLGANCGNFIPNCSTSPDCFCWTLSTGGGFCGQNFLCADFNNCGTGNTCPPGFVCAVDTCCDIPKCTPVSSLCPPNPGPSFVSPSLTGLTAAGPR